MFLVTLFMEDYDFFTVLLYFVKMSYSVRSFTIPLWLIAYRLFSLFFARLAFSFCS